MIYFDHNATTPLHPRAREAWLRATEEYVGNPSSPHRLGARADAALTRAREALARMLGCAASEVVWTSGATEASNAALHHAARTAAPGAPVWVSAIEHPCVIEAARRWFGAQVRAVPATSGGTVDVGWVAEALARDAARPGLIAVMAANNETGVLQPWREVLELARTHSVPVLCDAAQWLGKLPAGALGACDFVSGCAHKFGGPRGIGFLKCPSRGRFEPLVRGGPQEEGRRAGTENVAGALALVAMLEAREAALAAGDAEPRRAWRDAFVARLEVEVPGTRVLGADADRLWNTVAVLMPETGCRARWVVKLDKAGFAVSTGSACSSGQETPSHVLAAMGVPGAAAGRALRFSAGWETTRGEWDALGDALAKVFAGLKAA